MTTQKERLRELTGLLSLDSMQKVQALKGIDAMSEEKAREIADDLEDALKRLPLLVEELSTLLDAFEKAR